jgi:hypothetical protein
MITLPTVPPNEIIEYKTNIPYTALSTPQNTFSFLIVGLPINYVVCGTNMRLLTSFAAAGLSSLTVTLAAFVPNTILSNLNYYGLSMELTQFVTPTAFSQSGPPANNLSLGESESFAPVTGLYFNGAHDLAAYFTSTGALLSTLSAGVLEVTVQIRPM